MSDSKTVAIVMNNPTLSAATKVDYLITNASTEKATGEWIVTTYSQRNWVEVFSREDKGWLGLKEYQVRGDRSLYRHWILVFWAYSFIVWHTLNGGPRRSDAHQPLETFTDALSAFRTAISYRFVRWLQENMDVFTAYKASLGFIWA
jgi:hypothetical protein